MIIWIGIIVMVICGWIFRGEFDWKDKEELMWYVVFLLCVYILVRGLGGVWEDLFM